MIALVREKGAGVIADGMITGMIGKTTREKNADLAGSRSSAAPGTSATSSGRRSRRQRVPHRADRPSSQFSAWGAPADSRS
jgi:hypothetical protein